jgi:SAM-dependent methyltransferase
MSRGKASASTSTSDSAWYDVAFDDLYAELYAHRDQAEATAAVSWLRRELESRELGLLAGTPVVDLACGAGRHLRALAAAGARAVGVDRSRALLARARRAIPDAGDRGRALGEIALVQGDLRALPFRSGAFRGALSMFTSLGYFAEEAEHAAAFAEIRRVVAPRGWLLIDFLNAPQVAASLVPESTRAIGGYTVREARRIAGGRIEKEVTVTGKSGGDPVAHYRESVALWSRDELEARLARAGFASQTVAGDYAGAPHTERSPRLLVLAVRDLTPPLIPEFAA